MTDAPDAVLLEQFGKNGSEEAFTEIVRRHLGLVHSVALRCTQNAQHAEEITQAVFIILVRKAPSLGRKTILSGWLYHTARLTAANFQRAESRRGRREHEVFMQSPKHAEPVDSAWLELGPLLEEAMAKLGTTDRDAIVLRFFENKSLREVGTAMGLEERAAQKRVARGLEKLRAFFTKRGATFSAAVIAGAVSAHSVQAVPVGFATTIATVATKGAAVTSSTLTLAEGALKIMAWTKMKMTIVAGAVVVLAGITTTTVVKEYHRPSVVPTEAPKDFASEQAKITLPNWTVANSREPERSLLPYWWAQTFVSISTDETFHAQIDHLPITRKSDLTEAQDVALHRAFYSMLMAFSSESYETYREFRTPAPAKATLNLKSVDVQKKFLRTDWKNPSKNASDDPEDAFRAFWEVVYLNKYVNEPAGIKYSTIGKKLWQGISLTDTNTEILVEEISNQADLEKYMSSRMGSCVYSPSFSFENTPASILQQDGRVKVAAIKCLIKYPEPELSNPAYCRFYWDEKAGVWLPFDLEISLSGLRLTRDLVF